MARQTITPGGEIDALTSEEAESIIAGSVGGLKRPSAPVRDEATGVTDAAGLLELACFNVRVGQLFKLTRLYATQDGVSAAAPFTGAGAMLQVLRNGAPIFEVPLTAGGAPPLAALPISVSTGGDRDSLIFTNGDLFAVRFTAVNAARSTYVRYSGWLEPMESLDEGRGHHRRR